VERARPGQSFVTIGRVNATNKATARYQFVDKNPAVGPQLYRIALRNHAGERVYSALQSVVIANEAIRIFPNPTSGTVQITDPDQRAVRVELYDFQQRLLSQTTDLQSIELPGAGVYFVKIYAGQQLLKVERVVRY